MEWISEWKSDRILLVVGVASAAVGAGLTYLALKGRNEGNGKHCVCSQVNDDSTYALLMQTATIASKHINLLSDRARSVEPPLNAMTALAQLSDKLSPEGRTAEQVVAELGSIGGSATHTCSGGRYFGFVTGGTLPAALAADWLVSTWDQNSWNDLTSPAAVHFEGLAVKWLLELLHCPINSTGTLCSGCTAANTIALTAARDNVLETQGWGVDVNGLSGAPVISIYVGAEAHSSIFKALGVVGLGRASSGRNHTTVLPVDAQGAVTASALTGLQPPSAPAIVILQAGHVNTGAFDDFTAVIAWARSGPSNGIGIWVHVDGAFGLWASASTVPARSALTAGVGLADSWAVDLHKMLNVPYDSALVAVRRGQTLHASMNAVAPYTQGPTAASSDKVPTTNSTSDKVSGAACTPLRHMVPGLQNSKRARGMVAWAALQQLGVQGVAALVDRCCDHAARLAELVCDGDVGAQLVCPVIFNQALVTFGSDTRTAAVALAVQRDGRCWAAAAPYHGQIVLRLSVSSWMTNEADVEASAKAIVDVARKQAVDACGGR